MSDISEFREKIDAIDSQLLRLLNERASLAREIGVIKSRESLPIYAPDREVRLLRSLCERSEGPLRPESIKAIYREIMSASLSIEKDVIIACCAPSGSASHRAALSRFGSSVRYDFCPDVASVFSVVASDKADCGVVPIDDTDRGIANATLDQLASTQLAICAEIVESVEDGDIQPVRHLVIGRSANSPSGHDRTMLMLRIEDKPGALVSALEPFKELAINLHHFASRPAMKGSLDTFFFVEAEGHSRDLQMSDLFRDLSKRCRAVKVLGSFPSSTTPEAAA